MNYFWDKEEVFEKLENSMTKAFSAVYELSVEKKLVCVTPLISLPLTVLLMQSNCGAGHRPYNHKKTGGCNRGISLMNPDKIPGS